MDILQHLRFMAGHVAVDVDGDGQTRDVRGHLLDVDGECGGLAAKSGRSRAKGVDGVEELAFERRVERVGVWLAQRAHERALGKTCHVVEVAADTDPDNSCRYFRHCNKQDPDYAKQYRRDNISDLGNTHRND